MKFRTEYIPVKSSLILDPQTPIALVGSCFAQNIAAKMRECCWPVFSGLGNLYNPLSIAKVVELLLFSADLRSEISDSLFVSEGYTHSWLFDSRFSRQSSEDCLIAIEDARRDFSVALNAAQALIVTFGTAWCYYLNGKDDYVVANCHKMPQSFFLRRKVSIDEIVSVWVNLSNRLKERFPEMSIIFTVSPVRHLKDGFEGNARSKASLILAVEEICNRMGNALYFPAFELVTDDLRDYRFYASDLVHPSEQGVEYIWDIFRATFIDSKGDQVLREGNNAYKRQNHRPIKN